MGQHKVKEKQGDLISVLIPERGKPAELKALIGSLVDRSDKDKNIEILVAIDNDDPAWVDWPQGIEIFPDLPAYVRVFFWDRAITLGEKLNMMAKEAKGNILFFIANDYRMKTEGWPAKFRAAVKALPNGIGVPFPRDKLHPGHAAFPILTRKTCETVGFFMEPWTPVWWIDTWWDEIGTLTDTKRELQDVEIEHQGLRASSHPDIQFWAEFFDDTRPMRQKEAIDLIILAYGMGSPEQKRLAAEFNARVKLCADRTAHIRHPAFTEQWQSKPGAPLPSSDYVTAKKRATDLVAKMNEGKPKRVRVGFCVPSTETWRARMATDFAAMVYHSATIGIEVVIINLEMSMITHSRNSIAEMAKNNKCDFLMWCDSDMRMPPHTLARLLGHGKDIVGCIYNQKMPPFRTLGMLDGEKPEGGLTGELAKARLLPGGLLLVKASVYEKIGGPYYAECYRWPGADGFEAFCNMMRDYFCDVPPAAALQSVRDTEFGRWIKDHYNLGEFNNHLKLFSEDYFFCRKARKHGFDVWCDVALTFEIKHTGSLDVPCKDQASLSDEEKQQLVAAGFKLLGDRMPEQVLNGAE